MSEYDREQIKAGMSNIHDVLGVLDSKQDIKEARQWLIDTLSAGFDQIDEGIGYLTPEERRKTYGDYREV